MHSETSSTPIANLRLLDSSDGLPTISRPESLDATPGRIDLWFYPYENGDDDELTAQQVELLASDERERLARLRFRRDQRMFVATRALVRTVLSQYADVDPKQWRFKADDYGKPHLVEAPLSIPIHFNLANTRGLIVCAVSAIHPRVGVDVERLNRRQDIVRLAERYFAEPEVRSLNESPTEQQLKRFFMYWTLKESYIKARGLGLSIPLDKFWFRLDDPSIRVEFDDDIDDDETGWRFALLELDPYYLIAVGADTRSAKPVGSRTAHLVPSPLSQAASVTSVQPRLRLPLEENYVLKRVALGASIDKIDESEVLREHTLQQV